jgi:hypothetical protein
MRTVDVKECSTWIKRALREAFPDVKFSVRLSRYSGGHSIDVNWTDGPTDKQIKTILDRFDGEGFDGMTDCSYYCGERMFKGERIDLNSGYVRGGRSCSREFMRTVAARVCSEMGIEPPALHEKYACFVGGHDTRVPFQFWNHWLHADGKEGLTLCDLLSKSPILAHDAHEGEYLTRLIDKVMACVSLKPHARPVELPEYIDIQEKASTGRAEFEQPMPKFAGHEKYEKEALAIAGFEVN